MTYNKNDCTETCINFHGKRDPLIKKVIQDIGLLYDDPSVLVVDLNPKCDRLSKQSREVMVVHYKTTAIPPKYLRKLKNSSRDKCNPVYQEIVDDLLSRQPEFVPVKESIMEDEDVKDTKLDLPNSYEEIEGLTPGDYFEDFEHPPFIYTNEDPDKSNYPLENKTSDPFEGYLEDFRPNEDVSASVPILPSVIKVEPENFLSNEDVLPSHETIQSEPELEPPEQMPSNIETDLLSSEQKTESEEDVACLIYMPKTSNNKLDKEIDHFKVGKIPHNRVISEREFKNIIRYLFIRLLNYYKAKHLRLNFEHKYVYYVTVEFLKDLLTHTNPQFYSSDKEGFYEVIWILYSRVFNIYNVAFVDAQNQGKMLTIHEFLKNVNHNKLYEVTFLQLLEGRYDSGYKSIDGKNAPSFFKETVHPFTMKEIFKPTKKPFVMPTYKQIVDFIYPSALQKTGDQIDAYRLISDFHRYFSKIFKKNKFRGDDEQFDRILQSMFNQYSRNFHPNPINLEGAKNNDDYYGIRNDYGKKMKNDIFTVNGQIVDPNRQLTVAKAPVIVLRNGAESENGRAAEQIETNYDDDDEDGDQRAEDLPVVSSTIISPIE